MIKINIKYTLSLTLHLLLVGCLGITEVDQSNSTRSTGKALTGTNQALIYSDNPVILTGKDIKTAQYTGFLVPKFITDQPILKESCFFTQTSASPIVSSNVSAKDCFSVFNENIAGASELASVNRSWDFPPHSDEFYQVNTFYHKKLITKRFLEALSFAHDYVHFSSALTIPPSTKHNLADTQSFWLTDLGKLSPLRTFAKCRPTVEAFFSPAQDLVCFGVDSANGRFRMVQDPSVIYHEMGHAIVKIMMNQRNITKESLTLTDIAHPFESDLGEIFYDEAGAINEAIADYFSYVLNQRTEVAEFAFKFLVGQARPLEETAPAHSANISTLPGERLSYPQYLHYDPLVPGENIEDIHNAGAVVSHYLVALTKEFKRSCQFTTTDPHQIHKITTNYVLMLINETLAEMGDLTGSGSDFLSFAATANSALQNVFFTNLNNEASFLWTQNVNPPNYRRFSQAFAKYTLHYISDPQRGLCPQFNKDRLETLLDNFGLLLFKSYEDKGDGIHTQNFTSQSYALFQNNTIPVSSSLNRRVTPPIFNTRVNESNRRQSTLISKEFIELDDDPQAFVIDGQSAIRKVLSELTFEGNNVLTSQGLAGAEYNNNNIKFSPGEIVALALNVHNTSNSIMGGVQILANDWDHMKLNDSNHNYVNKTSNTNGLFNNTITGGVASHSPCQINGFPSLSEGGSTDSATSVPGQCSFQSKTNFQIDTSQVISGQSFPKFDLDSPQPICLVQFNDETDTKWVSQDFFRKRSIGLEDNDCLNNPSMSGNKFNPNECLVRFLPGANQVVYGKIDPQKSWTETLFNNENDIKFEFGQYFLVEINKLITPGTKFTCRFRARMSNCRDCFDNIQNSSDPTLGDYNDFEYTGHKPYKVLDFQFTVLD